MVLVDPRRIRYAQNYRRGVISHASLAGLVLCTNACNMPL